MPKPRFQLGKLGTLTHQMKASGLKLPKIWALHIPLSPQESQKWPTPSIKRQHCPLVGRLCCSLTQVINPVSGKEVRADPEGEVYHLEKRHPKTQLGTC